MTSNSTSSSDKENESPTNKIPSKSSKRNLNSIRSQSQSPSRLVNDEIIQDLPEDSKKEENLLDPDLSSHSSLDRELYKILYSSRSTSPSPSSSVYSLYDKKKKHSKSYYYESNSSSTVSSDTEDLHDENELINYLLNSTVLSKNKKEQKKFYSCKYLYKYLDIYIKL